MMNEMQENEPVLVKIMSLIEDQVSGSPIVLLFDDKDNWVLPIWIGDAEARAISMALNKTISPRPVTHKLLINTARTLGGKMEKIVIDKLIRNTYYASIYISSNGKSIAVDARPSDAIAVAAFEGLPIYVSKKLLMIAGQKLQQAKRDMTPEEQEKLKKMLEIARKREESSAA